MFSHVAGHTFLGSPLNDRSVILDLGANRGGFTKKMSSLYGGKYYLVEANPTLARMLTEEVQFPVTHCAVADREGPIEFHIAENHEGSSLLTLPERSAFNCVLQENVTVQARTLKSLVEELEIPDIDLLKMDIEGAEVGVLSTADSEFLKRTRQVTVEFHSDPVFGFGIATQVEAIIRRMEGLGFLTLDFTYPQRIDVLFVNKRFHKVPLMDLARVKYREFLPPGSRRLVQMLLPPGLRKKIRGAVEGIPTESPQPAGGAPRAV